VFVGNRTLEVDLFDSGHGQEIVDSLRELGASDAMADAVQELTGRHEALEDKGIETLLRALDRFGKGRIAQRLAGKIDINRCPLYIKNAVRQLVEVLSNDHSRHLAS